MFSGDGNARTVISAPSSDTKCPAGETIGSPQCGLQHRARAHDQQRSKVRISVPSDAPQPRLAAGRVLLRREAEPRSELPAVLELVRIGDACNDRRCADRADAAQLPDALGALVLARVLLELSFVLSDAFIENSYVREKIA